MKISLIRLCAGLKYLSNRTPGMAETCEVSEAFAEVAPYRDGAIYVGFYSGTSEWERHPSGDELVVALEGRTTVEILGKVGLERVSLTEMELTIVPAGVWHRFEGSHLLKVFTITPQPTDHSVEEPSS